MTLSQNYEKKIESLTYLEEILTSKVKNNDILS